MTSGARLLTWRGGTHQFCLASVGLMLALEESRKAPIALIFARLAGGRWHLNDARETIRLGLIGGGMSANDAVVAVRQHVDECSLGFLHAALLAAAILEAVLIPEEQPETVARAGAAESRVTVFHDDGRLKRSAILGLGAGLGWPPSLTYAASIWEISACIDGHNRVAGAEAIEPPSDAEFDAMIARHDVHATVQ